MLRLAHLVEKGGFFGWYKFVNAYVERDKKNLKLAVFGVQVTAFLIENLTQIMSRIAYIVGENFATNTRRH